MLRRGLLLASTVAVSSLACGSGEGPPPLTPPRTGTDYVIWGTAAAGRGVQPGAVRIARATDVGPFRADPIGGGNVDVFYAGLRAEDLPEGLEPTSLEVVPQTDARAHPLPALYAPHVLERPGSFEARLTLAPVDAPSLPSGLRVDREERLRTMLEGLAVKDPCEEPLSPITVTTPRTPGEEIRALRTLSSGETWVGFTVTSTVILGVLRPGERELENVGVSTSTTGGISRDERTRILDLGDSEVAGPGGRPVPGELALSYLAAFGGLGQVLRFDEALGRFADDSPQAVDDRMQPVLPNLLSGTRHVHLSGEPALCTYGQVRGPNRVGGIWCRTATSTTWTVSAQLRDAYTVYELVERPGREPLAFDVAGTVYAHGPSGWRPIARPALNDGCAPPCVTFGRAAAPRTPSGGLLALIAGSDATLLAVEDRGGDAVELTPVPAAASVLFARQPKGAEQPLRFSSLSFAPDGAVWVGTQGPVLVRLDPDRAHARRICLPSEARGAEVTAIEAHPSGALYLGMTPALLGFGDWRE